MKETGMRKTTALLLALSVLAAPLSEAMASPMPKSPDLTRVYPGETYVQYRDPYYRGGPRYYGPRYYGRPHYYRRGNGAAVAAGVAGLAAGALIGSAIASQAQAAPPPPPAAVDPQLSAYCARKYRSFDPVTGTYLAYTGERIVCTYP
jgi:hypothetical protein